MIGVDIIECSEVRVALVLSASLPYLFHGELCLSQSEYERSRRRTQCEKHIAMDYGEWRLRYHCLEGRIVPNRVWPIGVQATTRSPCSANSTRFPAWLIKIGAQ